MASVLFPAIVTVLVIVVSYLLNSATKILKILFTRPIQRNGAVEIDKKEHIYSHPDFTTALQDFDTMEYKTLYDVLQRGLKIAGDRPQFSYRHSSDQPFQSYTYK
jgi:hypothetical protein